MQCSYWALFAAKCTIVAGISCNRASIDFIYTSFVSTLRQLGKITNAHVSNATRQVNRLDKADVVSFWKADVMRNENLHLRVKCIKYKACLLTRAQ